MSNLLKQLLTAAIAAVLASAAAFANKQNGVGIESSDAGKIADRSTITKVPSR